MEVEEKWRKSIASNKDKVKDANKRITELMSELAKAKKEQKAKLTKPTKKPLPAILICLLSKCN